MRSDVLNQNSNAYDGRTKPEKIFEWDYISCAHPIVSNTGVSADGVMAEGDKYGMLFPGSNGQLYPATCCNIGVAAATTNWPTVVGTVAATDASATAAGLSFHMDNGNADNTGIEMVLGGSQFGSNSNKFIAGTHSGSIDVTWGNADYSDYDCMVVGFRKVQEFAPGHGDILAAASGDPLYTDFVAFGVQSADDVQIASDLNDGGASSAVYTDSTQATAADGNHRFRIELASSGAVTYSHIGAAVMRQGVLAAPTVTAAFTFDSGDILVPYLFIQGVNQDSDVWLKSLDITRTPSIDGHSVA